MTAVTEDRSPEAARPAAIEDSGWGRKVTIFQPRNLCFWVMAVLLVSGGLHALAEIQPGVLAYGNSVAQGTLYFALLGGFILWIIMRLDRYSRLPGKVVLLTIFVGGLVSTFAIAQLYNNAMLAILTKTQGPAFVLDWGPGLVAPISEEVAKQIPLILLIGLTPRVVRSAFDGLVIGMLSGLAFQIFEDVTYVYHGVEAEFGNTAAGVTTMFARTVFGFTGHWMWSGVVGAGVVYLVGRPNEPRNVVKGAALVLVPMFAHGAWDAATALGGGGPLGFVVMFSMVIVTVGLLVWTYRHTVQREQQWMRDILAPEVANGMIDEDELEASVARRKLRRHYVKSQSGHAARRRTQHVIDAIRDLADSVAASGGADSKDVLHSRAEIVRLRAA